MKCEACGGDGQIEYGAYRGDESGPTRECQLCGGPKLVIDIPANISIDNAVKALTQLGQVAAKAGDSVGKWSDSNRVLVNAREESRAVLRTAREVADRLLKQPQQENGQPKTERSTNDTMNDLIRRSVL